MLCLVPIIASALMFLFAFCAVRAIRDYSGAWITYSLLAGVMFGIDVLMAMMIIGEFISR